MEKRERKGERERKTKSASSGKKCFSPTTNRKEDMNNRRVGKEERGRMGKGDELEERKRERDKCGWETGEIEGVKRRDRKRE